MSHSTTATASYVLQKYSKSYPHPDRPGNSDWQHFTNPTIRLVLDVRKSKAELESVRLRILWTMDCNEIVFEDIDLLSFSSLPSRKFDKQQVRGLPLKAVYRDSIVGIRYLHSQGDPSNSTYRRFQITFASISDVSDFVNSISSVCPCKANTYPGQNSIAMSAGSIMPSVMQYSAPINASNLARSNPSSQPPGQRLYPEVYGSSTFSPSPQPINSPSVAHFPAGLPISSPTRQDSLQLMSTPSPNPSTAHLQYSLSQSRFQAARCSSSNDPDDRRSQSSLVNSLNNSAPVQAPSDLIHPLRLELADKIVQTSDAFVAALEETTSLYNLPHSALEKLIGDVIREDSFIDLMRSLSSMWRIKSYLNQ